MFCEVQCEYSLSCENLRLTFDIFLVSAASKNGYQEEQVSGPNEEEEKSSPENVLPEDGQPKPEDLPEAATDEQNSSEILEQAVPKENSVEDSGRENEEDLSKETQQPSVESAGQDVYSGEKQSESGDTGAHNVEDADNKVRTIRRASVTHSLNMCLIAYVVVS